MHNRKFLDKRVELNYVQNVSLFGVESNTPFTSLLESVSGFGFGVSGCCDGKVGHDQGRRITVQVPLSVLFL